MAQAVRWGKEQQQENNNYIERIIGQDQQGFYVSRTKSRLFGTNTPMVEHYDNEMNLQFAAPLKTLAQKNINVDNYWHFNNRLFVYYTVYNRKSSLQILHYQEIDKQTGKLLGKPTVLTQVPSYGRNSIGQLEYGAATDSSYAAVLYSPYLESGLFQKKKNASFQLQVVDKDFKTIWNKSVEAPYAYDLFDIEKVDVDRNGNAYVLAKIYIRKRQEKSSGRVNFYYKVLVYKDKGESLQEYELKLDQMYITDITFKVGRKQLITCAGFYSERRTTSIKGAFFFTINPSSNKIITKGYKPFTKDFLRQLTSKRRVRKGKELYRYYLDDIILRSDGGAVLVGEQYYVTTNTYYTGAGLNRTANTTYTYHYEDVIVININPDASIAWSAAIPKDQSASTKRFSSYAMAIIRGKIHFIYNDRISKKAPVMHATVNTRGYVDIKELFSNKEFGIITRPLLCKQVSKTEMLIYGERGKRYKFGMIDFGSDGE